MKVICISGKAQHGKDTVASKIKEALENDEHTVLITHYADLVKYICEKFFEWDGVKDERGRSLLQKVGTDIVRENDADFWVYFIVKILRFFPNNWDYVIIPDCRFENEIDIMESNFDTITLRVIRTKGESGDIFESNLSNDQKSHKSETSLDNYEFDSYLYNPGTIDGLDNAVSKWIKENIYNEEN